MAPCDVLGEQQKLVAEIHRLLDEQLNALKHRIQAVEVMEWIERQKRIKALFVELTEGDAGEKSGDGF